MTNKKGNDTTEADSCGMANRKGNGKADSMGSVGDLPAGYGLGEGGVVGGLAAESGG
jgi:hypothetical protein